MKLEQAKIGQIYYQPFLSDGSDVGNGDRWTTREEAEAEGAEMLESYDPARIGGRAVGLYVTAFVVDVVDENGTVVETHAMHGQ